MPTGLTRRGARYSIRRRIPLDLVQHFNGKTEIIQALGTADPKVARKLLPLKWVALDREFEAIRAKVAGAPDAVASPLKPQKSPSLRKQTPPEAMSEAEWNYQVEADEFNRQQDAREEFERDGREELERKILAYVDGPAEGLSPEQLAVRDLMRDRAEFRQIAEARADLANSELKQAKTAPKPEGEPKPTLTTGTATTLDTVVDRWAAERKVGAKGVDTHRAVARWFVERLGELPVEKITKKDVLSFKDKMLAEGTSAANVKVKLTRLQTLLNYAASNDIIPKNPAKDFIFVVPEAEKIKRRPFDLPSLTAIFGSPVYSQGARPTGGRGEAAYWLPLLALFTGARLEELGQLRPTDVRQEAYPDADDNEQKAWFIHVTKDEEDDLKLKNAGSERIIPVHPALEQQGFIRFVLAARDAGQARLFPALRPNKYGRLTAKWGEWFGDYKRTVVGITDRRLVFHSFRHTFKDNARGRIGEGVQRQIMGHSSADVADAYGSGHPLWQLVDEMRQYRVPGFKMPPPPAAFRGPT
jgi:integrase